MSKYDSYSTPPHFSNWQKATAEGWKLSFSLMEVMTARTLMVAAAMAGETRHAAELSSMISEKFAVLPEIGGAILSESFKLASSGRAHFSDTDLLAWQKAVSAPVHKRVHANAKRLRKRK